MTQHHASADASAVSPQVPAGFGASRLLQRQLKTGRMFTAGNGAPLAASGSQAPAQAGTASAQGASEPTSSTSGPASADSTVVPDGAAAQRPPLGFGFARTEPSKPEARAPRASAAPASEAQKAAPGGFESVIKSARATEAVKVHISTVKLLTRLLGAVAARPGIMAEEQVRTDTLRGLHRQATTLGDALARRCVLEGPVPEWLRAQAVDAAAATLCMAWEGGLSSDQIRAFEHTLADQIGVIAQEAESISGRAGFDGYQVADNVETAQARLYVSVTAAIGRLTVSGVPVERAAHAVGEIVDVLEATPTHATMKLDLRTAWLQGSLGRCTDLMTAVLQSKALATGGEDRVAFAQRQALNLIQEVESYAHNLIHRKFGEPEGPADRDPPTAGDLPRAG